MNFGDGIHFDEKVPEFQKFLELDPHIKHYENEIRQRYAGRWPSFCALFSTNLIDC